MPVRVLIVDPQPFFCESLADALDRDPQIDVVGWATDEHEAARLASTSSPDVVLTELELGSGSGLSLARRMNDRTKVVVLTRRHEGDVVLDVVATGASGCLGHDLAAADLPHLIDLAAAGRFVVNLERLGETLRRAGSVLTPRVDGPSDLARLTAREREVLHLLTEGLENVDIGKRLHLSAHTIRTHVGNILRKLGAHSRAEVVRIALHTREGEPTTRVLHIEGPDLGKA